MIRYEAECMVAEMTTTIGGFRKGQHVEIRPCHRPDAFPLHACLDSRWLPVLPFEVRGLTRDARALIESVTP